MFKEYAAYLKDNPHGYWFKRKLFGWGWVPVRWQGWLVVACFIALILVATKFFLRAERIGEYFLVVVIGVAGVIAFGYWKGEKPRWQWGLRGIKKSNRN